MVVGCKEHDGCKSVRAQEMQTCQSKLTAPGDDAQTRPFEAKLQSDPLNAGFKEFPPRS